MSKYYVVNDHNSRSLLHVIRALNHKIKNIYIYIFNFIKLNTYIYIYIKGGGGGNHSIKSREVA